MGEQWKQWQTLFSWTPKSLQIVTAAMKLKDAYSLEAKESIPSNCGSGEDAWESLSSKKIKEIKPVNPKGTWLWIFIGSTDSEASVFWPPPWKSWLIGRDPDARKDWGQGENGVTWWDGWMASLTRWTGVWASSGSWWWTGKPGMLQSMGSQESDAAEWPNYKLISAWYFLIFSISVEIPTLFINCLTSMSIFMPAILNSLSCKSVYLCFINVFFWHFILFFCLEYIPLFLYFPWLCVGFLCFIDYSAVC